MGRLNTLIRLTKCFAQVNGRLNTPTMFGTMTDHDRLTHTGSIDKIFGAMHDRLNTQLRLTKRLVPW